MSKEKEQSDKDHVGGREAVVTLLAADLGVSERQVHTALETLIATGTEEQKGNFLKGVARMDAAVNKMTGMTLEQQRRALRIIARVLMVLNVITLKTVMRWARRQQPGATMLLIAQIFFSERKIERVFKPIVADYRLEFNEAKGWFKQTIVRVQHWHGFAKACGLDKALDLIGALTKLINL